MPNTPNPVRMMALEILLESVYKDFLKNGSPKTLDPRVWTGLRDAYRETNLRELLQFYLEGISVSLDVSTSETDAGNRYFGEVSEVMDNPGTKYGFVLLVQNPEPNF